jgi:hypothetical protein
MYPHWDFCFDINHLATLASTKVGRVRQLTCRLMNRTLVKNVDLASFTWQETKMFWFLAQITNSGMELE